MKEETRTGALKGKFAYMAPGADRRTVAGAAVGHLLRRRRAARDAHRAAPVQGRQRLRHAAEGADDAGAAAVVAATGRVAGARRHRHAGARSRSQGALRAAPRTWRATSTCSCRRTALPSRTWRSYMRDIFPADAREDVPDGPMTASYSIRRSRSRRCRRSRAPSRARRRGARRAVQAEHAQAAATAGRKRTLLYVGAVAAAVAVAAIVVVPLARGARAVAAARGDGHDDSRAVVEPIVRPVEDKPHRQRPSRRDRRSTRRCRATCAWPPSRRARRSTPGPSSSARRR